MMSRRKNFKTSDPTTWAADPTTILPDPTGQRRRPTAESGGERQSSTSGLMFNAIVVENEYHPAEMEPDVTVMPPVHNELTGNANASEPGPSVASSSTKPNATVTNCEQCGAAFTPRRPHGRFCSSYCRRLAWLGRNPERAAELAARDRQRLREHIIGCGGEWVDRV